MSGEPVIETRALRKCHGGRDAVRGLTVEIPQGSICGFLGRNGAGKTTTLKMLIRTTGPSGGDSSAFGFRRPAREHRDPRRTGFVSEDKRFPNTATMEEMLRFTRVFPGWNSALEQRYLQAFQLSPAAACGKFVEGDAMPPRAAPFDSSRRESAPARRTHERARPGDDRVDSARPSFSPRPRSPISSTRCVRSDPICWELMIRSLKPARLSRTVSSP